MNWFKTLLLVFARLIIKKYGVISWTRPSDNPDRVFRYPDKPGTNRERALAILQKPQIETPLTPEAKELYLRLKAQRPRYSNSGEKFKFTRTPDSESKLEKNPFNPKNTTYPIFGSNQTSCPKISDEISLRDKAIAAFNNPSEYMVKVAAHLDQQRELIQSRAHIYSIAKETK